MQDQRTTPKRADDSAIRAAINSAWDRVVVQEGRAKRQRWSELDLATAALKDLRASGYEVSCWAVTQVLGVLVADGFFLQRLADGLCWALGDVNLGADFLDALDEVAVGNLVDAAFAADSGSAA